MYKFKKKQGILQHSFGEISVCFQNEGSIHDIGFYLYWKKYKAVSPMYSSLWELKNDWEDGLMSFANDPSDGELPAVWPEIDFIA